MTQVPTKFVSLHSHDGFSVYDGLGYPQEHMDFVKENGMDAWCLTNHGHMNSFAHAYLHSKGMENFKLIVGSELYLHPDLKEWSKEKEADDDKKKSVREAEKLRKKMKEKFVSPIVATVDEDDETLDLGVDNSNALTIENEDETKSSKFFDPIKRRHHLVVLPKTSEGLERIFHLVSRGYLEGFYRFPRIDYRMLKEAASGGHLMVSTACLGGPLCYEVFQEIQGVEFDEMDASLLDDPNLMSRILARMGNVHDRLSDAMGPENVFLEIQFNRLPAQNLVNRAIMTYAKRHGLESQLVVTADSHYPRPEQWMERELYKKLGWIKYTDIENHSLPTSTDQLKCELYPKNASQVWAAYQESKQGHSWYDDQRVFDAIERTHGIAHDFIGNVKPNTSPKLPQYAVPEKYRGQERGDVKALVEMVKQGMRERGVDKKPEYVERAAMEMRIICKDTKFQLYFLTMKMIMDIARDVTLPGPGRGSGAGSLVNYVLGITDVDPLRYDLLFTRFLSAFRQGLPDIDSDFADRDLLVNTLRERLGPENVIPISNYNTFKLKTLVKDISKFHGISFEEANAATRTVDEECRKATQKHGEDKNLFVLTYEMAMEHCASFRAFIEKNPKVAEAITVLFKQNRSLGRHAGGVLVSDNIPKRMPLITSKGEAQSPWVEGVNFKHLEKMGWIKFDLLGLETMRMIQRTIEILIQRRKKDEGWFEFALEDGKVKRMLGNELVKTKRGIIKAKDIKDGDDVVSFNVHPGTKAEPPWHDKYAGKPDHAAAGWRPD